MELANPERELGGVVEEGCAERCGERRNVTIIGMEEERKLEACERLVGY